MTVDEAKAYVAKIRQKYPVVYMSSGAMFTPETGCCIGGALLNSRNSSHLNDRFPLRRTRLVCNKLLELNQCLSLFAAETFQDKIMFYNDSGSFEDGWSILERALSHISPK
jgi:hypothetical protein